ncbi:jg12690 [Pararge aegeria aegeria]|uniref:Jg12690 protein n=1 Tax=Pararge aegeria aegeria TaxID=348720 RepID=A0A8S4RXR4_9NEOP|nr:jg12690 [Pararge aegeria aegeria]
MLKVLALVIFVWGCNAWAEESLLINKLTDKNARQKRLLFYDGEGQLVNTYGNSLYHYGRNEQENLFHWTFLNNFLSPIFPTAIGRTSIAYMVPVSDAVVQQINKDPVYQNKLLILTYKDPLVEVNPLCSGRRAQIPSTNLCSNFLNCWDGWAFEQECPAGLMFSTEGYCDYPQNVNCNNRKVKEPVSPMCSKEFEAFRNKVDCSEFFVCVNSLPVRFKCPADLAYSEVLGICDYPGRVACNFTQLITPSAPSSVQTTQLFTEATSTITPSESSTTAASTAAPISNQNRDKNMVINKYEYNTQSWSSTHVAVSRQDAIRQLQLGKIAQISVDN